MVGPVERLDRVGRDVAPHDGVGRRGDVRVEPLLAYGSELSLGLDDRGPRRGELCLPLGDNVEPGAGRLEPGGSLSLLCERGGDILLDG